MRRVINMYAPPMMILRDMLLATIASLQIELSMVEACIKAGEDVPVRVKERVTQVLMRSRDHIDAAPVVQKICGEDEIPF